MFLSFKILWINVNSRRDCKIYISQFLQITIIRSQAFPTHRHHKLRQIIFRHIHLKCVCKCCRINLHCISEAVLKLRSYIGPCAAKKLEASRRTVRSDVDFVLTFEELAGIIEGKDLDIDLLEVDENEAALCSASAAGRGFAQSGGVANAVANKIKEWHPDMEVKIASAQGLADCKKLLMLAKAGKYNGYLLEGMGCPGGCIGGAGTIADPARTAIQLNKYMKEAPFTDPEQSPYMSEIHVLKDDPNFEL